MFSFELHTKNHSQPPPTATHKHTSHQIHPNGLEDQSEYKTSLFLPFLLTNQSQEKTLIFATTSITFDSSLKITLLHVIHDTQTVPIKIICLPLHLFLPFTVPAKSKKWLIPVLCNGPTAPDLRLIAIHTSYKNPQVKTPQEHKTHATTTYIITNNTSISKQLPCW